jgi:hypothetical protein
MKYDSFVELINCPDLAFVARAIAKTEDVKPQFEYMKIDEQDGFLIAAAADGKRLHKAVIDKEEVGDVSPGYWKVLRNEIVKEQFHDAGDNCLVYKRKEILWLVREKEPVFPYEISERLFVYFQGNPMREGDIITDECYHEQLNTFIKKLPEPDGMNFNYLWDLGPYEWHYKIFGAAEPVLFESGNKTALIMPLTLF